MLYARVVHEVTKRHAMAGIQAVLGETVLDHASRYVLEFVYAHVLPIKAKPYPLRIPIPRMNREAGRTAPGALAKEAMPAGRPKTPAPTIPATFHMVSSVSCSTNQVGLRYV
jgi:hypothetical protein